MTPTENRILRFLYQHLDKTIAAEALIHAAGLRNVEDMEAARNSLQVHVNRLRNQLTRYSSPLWVYTVRGVGYRLEKVTSD